MTERRSSTAVLPPVQIVKARDPAEWHTFLRWLEDHRATCLHCDVAHSLLEHWSFCPVRPPIRLTDGSRMQPRHEWGLL